MTKKQFSSRFHGVNGPEYRGAPYPKFDPAAVNECEFSDELRFKNYDFSFKDDGSIDIDWESQSWDEDGIDELSAEIKHCLDYIGFRGHAMLSVHDRDGYNEEVVDIEV